MWFKLSCIVLIIHTYLLLSNSNPIADLEDGIALNEFVAFRSGDYKHDCVEATAKTERSAIYKIVIPSYSEDPFKVVCDAETQGGGWTVILKRMDGSVSFYRNWRAYKKGFGDFDGEFFLGLDKIHALTSEESQELLVLLEDFNGNSTYEKYDKFAIGDESEGYALNILGKASGTAGDSLRIHHGKNFSTFDHDSTGGCAKGSHGAWWYENCHRRYKGIFIAFKAALITFYPFSNLAGKYNSTERGKGVNWQSWRGWEYSLKSATMMIRPKGFA